MAGTQRNSNDVSGANFEINHSRPISQKPNKNGTTEAHRHYWTVLLFLIKPNYWVHFFRDLSKNKAK